MGRFTRTGAYGGSITCFEPNNTSTTFYWKTDGLTQLVDAISAASEHFKISTYECMTRCQIEAEYIHTDCIYYDSFDPDDWTNYICFTYTPKT